MGTYALPLRTVTFTFVKMSGAVKARPPVLRQKRVPCPTPCPQRPRREGVTADFRDPPPSSSPHIRERVEGLRLKKLTREAHLLMPEIPATGEEIRLHQNMAFDHGGYAAAGARSFNRLGLLQFPSLQ